MASPNESVPVSNKRKVVQIKLQDRENKSEPVLLEIAIPDRPEESRMEGERDFDYVLQAVKAKRPRLSTVLNNGSFKLQVESEHFKGEYVDCGEDSPVKNKSRLLCVYNAKIPQFHFDKSAMDNEMEPLQETRLLHTPTECN